MPRTYTKYELSDITGIPFRTITHYVTEKLLSPRLPRNGNIRNGTYRAYTSVHLAELRRIQEIMDARRTIADIRDILHPVKDDE